jgi:hypothetical protein
MTGLDSVHDIAGLCSRPFVDQHNTQHLLVLQEVTVHQANTPTLEELIEQTLL